MFGMIGKIICGVLALLSFGYSGVCLFTNTDKQAAAIVEVADCNVHPENEGKMVMLRGKLTYDKTFTVDPDLGVKVRTPILVRHTEMFQYKSQGTENNRTMTTTWSKDGIVGFTDRYKHHYSNPTFPSDIPRSKVFASDLRVNNGNLKIDAEFVKALSAGKYYTFKDTYGTFFKNVTGLHNSSKLPKDFVTTGDKYYRPYKNTDPLFIDLLRSGKRNSHVGDIRIRYQALKWSDDLPEFTVIGLQEKGKLMHKEGSLFYDYRIQDKDDLSREVRKNNRNAMFGALGCGIILSILTLVI